MRSDTTADDTKTSIRLFTPDAMLLRGTGAADTSPRADELGSSRRAEGADFGTGGGVGREPSANSPRADFAGTHLAIPSFQMRSVGESFPSAANWRSSEVDTGPLRTSATEYHHSLDPEAMVFERIPFQEEAGSTLPQGVRR